MKAKLVKKLIASFCLTAMIASVIPANAAGTEYYLNPDKPHPEITVAEPTDGSKLSQDFYVYDNHLYYSTYTANGPIDDVNITYTLNCYVADMDGKNPVMIATQTITAPPIEEAAPARIELVTENFLLVPISIMTPADEMLMIDRRTGEAKSIDPIVRAGISDKEYAKDHPSIAHEGDYYLMMGARSDVSSTRIVLFNGKTGAITTVAKKGWDGCFFNKKLYYLFEKKDQLYVGCCNYNGKNNKTLGAVDTPDGHVFASIKSIDKNGLKCVVASSKGNKTKTISLKK